MSSPCSTLVLSKDLEAIVCKRHAEELKKRLGDSVVLDPRLFLYMLKTLLPPQFHGSGTLAPDGLDCPPNVVPGFARALKGVQTLSGLVQQGRIGDTS